MMTPWERERLEELRRERRKNERPVLYVPVPEPPRRPAPERPSYEAPERGVAVIDFSF